MTRLTSLVFAGLLAAACLVPSVLPARGQAADRAQERNDVAERMFADLMNGTVSIYLEGNVATPFLTDATFDKRVRVSDKEYLLFTTKDGDKVLVRTQQIVAVRIRKK